MKRTVNDDWLAGWVGAGLRGGDSGGDNVTLVFGVTTVAAGVLGVVTGSAAGQLGRQRWATADAWVCAVGLLASAPLLAWGAAIADGDAAVTFAVLFFAQWFLNLNWSLVGDILLVPRRRRRRLFFFRSSIAVPPVAPLPKDSICLGNYSRPFLLKKFPIQRMLLVTRSISNVLLL